MVLLGEGRSGGDSRAGRRVYRSTRLLRLVVGRSQRRGREADAFRGCIARSVLALASSDLAQGSVALEDGDLDALAGETCERLVHVVPAVEADRVRLRDEPLEARYPGLVGRRLHVDRQLAQRLHEVVRLGLVL